MRQRKGWTWVRGWAVIGASLAAGSAVAGSFVFQYDDDGRLLSMAKSGDTSVYAPTPAHNLSSALTLSDANTNGLPDSIEDSLAQRWGAGYDPMTCDSDGDGVSDANELTAGTIPFSPDSRFSGSLASVSNSGTAGSGYTLNWPSTPFHTYSVQWVYNLTDSWTTLASNLPATPPVNSWTHEGDTNTRGFYRIFSKTEGAAQ